MHRITLQLLRKNDFFQQPASTDNVRFVSRLLPMLRDASPSLAPQHEVVVFQRVRPHPRVTASPLSLEEVTNGSRECAPDDRLRGPSRRMGCNTDL